MTPLLPGNYYHIYNRSISGSLLFYNDENYFYFLKKIKKYLKEIVYIYSYCLLPNHFHLLVKIKEFGTDINYSKVFSNFFNSYSKSINKEQTRHGSLFEKPFKRKFIETEDYLRILINYIHRNPIHHGISNDITVYKWSSYQSIITGNNDIVEINEILNLFGDFDTFKDYVRQSIDDFKDLNLE